MTPQELKNSILQLAIQGKLVEQRPEEGTAEELYRQIQQEKQALIKAGKIKKEKPLPEIAEDEIPFEIPESWKWVRLGDYCQKITDQVASGSFATLRENVPSLKEPDYAIMVKTADFSNNFTRNLTYTTKHGYDFLENSNLFGGELILSNIGSIGKCFIVPYLPHKMTLAPNAVMVRLMNDEHRDYLYRFILSPQGYQELSDITSGTAMKKFNKTDLKTILVPLPPLAEQKRIVAKIEELLPYIDRYEKAWNRLEDFNKRFPADMQKSILQLAIQGKLVEQRPEEGTGKELYKQIKEETASLIAAKAIKEEKLQDEIDESEIPFDIPANWTWVRFGNLGRYKKGPFGSALTKGIFVPKSNDTVKVYEQKNAIQKDASLGEYYIAKDYFESKMTGFEVQPGDIIVSCAGTIGETFVLPDGIEKGIINQALMRMRLFKPIYVPYFLMFFDVVLKQNAQQNSKGSAIKNIPPFEILKNYLVPLPPLAEQKRIVAKLEELLPLCEKLKG